MTQNVSNDGNLLSPAGAGAQVADISDRGQDDLAVTAGAEDEVSTIDAALLPGAAAHAGLCETETGTVDPDIIPENPDGYALTLDESLGDVDPALNARLHAAGFNNAQAQLVYDLAGEIIPSMVEQVQQAGQRATDRAALVAEFGGAAAWTALAPKIEKWGRENLPDAAFDAMCQTASGVRALHRLMTAGKETGLGNAAASDGGTDTRSDIQRKMNDPRYWRDRDPGIVAEVQEAFARLQG